jgi:hypothetical protein
MKEASPEASLEASPKASPEASPDKKGRQAAACPFLDKFQRSVVRTII